MVVLLATLASANINDLKITHSGIDKVAPGTEASLELTLQNDGHEKLVLDLSKDPFVNLPDSIFEYITLDPNRVELLPGKSETVNVNFKIKRTVRTDESYSTFIKATVLGDISKNIKHNLIIRVEPPEDVVTMNIKPMLRVKPGSHYEIELNLTNNLNVLLSEIELFIASDFFEDAKTLKILPLSTRSELFKFKVPESVKPGKYGLSVRLYFDKQLADKQTFNFDVSTISNVDFQTETGKSFLKRWLIVRKSNLGNVEAEESYSMQLSWFQKVFASFNPEPTLIDDYGAHWQFVVQPNTEYTIKVTINYQPFFWVLIILFVFGMFSYYILTRGVIVKKEILKLKSTKEGASELRVMIHIKNNSRKTLKHVNLIEILPHHIHPKTHFDTLKPNKVQKGAPGIRLLWEIPEIVKSEERIITYSVETKVGVLGKVTLPPAMLRFKTSGNKVGSIKSNEISFISGLSEKD